MASLLFVLFVRLLTLPTTPGEARPSSSSPLPPDEGHGSGLLHPRRRLALVEIVRDASSTPRVDLPIPTGSTGGSGLISVPRMNINFTWPTKAPDEKHHPSPTP